MFNKNQKRENSTKASQNSTISGNSFNSLVEGTTIHGDITANQNIRIDGVLIGNLNCTEKLVIGPSGQIEGEVTCTNAVVEGKFKGKITVKDSLNIRENAEVEGTIRYSSLIVQPGAVLVGDVSMYEENNFTSSKSTKEKTATIIN